MAEKDNQTQLPTPADLARVLREGARNQESLKATAPVRKAVANRLNDLSGGTVVPARTDVPSKEGTHVQFLDSLDVTTKRLFPILRFNPSVVWWGIYFWGKQEEADQVFNAVQSLGLSNTGWRLERGTGVPEMPPSVSLRGMYLRAFSDVTADQVEELPTLEGLVSQIAADLWWWYQRLDQVMVLAKWIGTNRGRR